MKKLFEKLKRKEGWATLVVIFVLSSILPVFLFFFVELNYLFGVKDQSQYIADNIASSAVRSIDQEKLKDIQIEIVEEEAVQTATDLFRASYRLNGDLSTGSRSNLREDPVLKVYVVNEVTQPGMPYVTDEGFQIDINRPTVIVYTSVKPKGVFFNRIVNIQSYSVYEANAILQTGNKTTTTTSPSKITTINRTTYNVSGATTGILEHDVIDGSSDYNFNFSDGTSGRMHFINEFEARFEKDELNGGKTTGILTLGKGSTQTNLAGTHKFTLAGNKGNYNITFQRVKSEIITKEEPGNSSTVITPVTTVKEIRYEKIYLELMKEGI